MAQMVQHDSPARLVTLDIGTSLVGSDSQAGFHPHVSTETTDSPGNELTRSQVPSHASHVLVFGRSRFARKIPMLNTTE